MGVTYIVANSTKLQYFDPGRVGINENTRWPSLLRGLSGHALAHLIRPLDDQDVGFHLTSWIGDDFFTVSDSGAADANPYLKPFHSDDDCEWTTVTENFEDISLNLIAVLCLQREILEVFIDKAKSSDEVLICLVHSMTGLNATHIESAIVERFGVDWSRHYKNAMKRVPQGMKLQPIVPRHDAG